MLQNLNEIDISDIKCHICNSKFIIKYDTGITHSTEIYCVYNIGHIFFRSDNFIFYRYSILNDNNKILSRFRLNGGNITEIQFKNDFDYDNIVKCPIYFPLKLTKNYYNDFLSFKDEMIKKVKLYNLLN